MNKTTNPYFEILILCILITSSQSYGCYNIIVWHAPYHSCYMASDGVIIGLYKYGLDRCYIDPCSSSLEDYTNI